MQEVEKSKDLISIFMDWSKMHNCALLWLNVIVLEDLRSSRVCTLLLFRSCLPCIMLRFLILFVKNFFIKHVIQFIIQAFNMKISLHHFLKWILLLIFIFNHF